MSAWWIYLLQCRDDSFYCGITSNLDRRVKEHNSGRGAKYTKARRPVKLVNSKKCLSRSNAMKLELRIKKMNRIRKIAFFQE